MPEPTTDKAEAKPELSQSQKEALERKELRTRAAKAYSVFRGDKFGLSPVGASILAAHFDSNVKGAPEMKQAQIVEWAEQFRAAFPTAWHAVKSSHVMAWMAHLRRCRIETILDIDDYNALSAVIRGG